MSHVAWFAVYLQVDATEVTPIINIRLRVYSILVKYNRKRCGIVVKYNRMRCGIVVKSNRMRCAKRIDILSQEDVSIGIEAIQEVQITKILSNPLPTPGNLTSSPRINGQLCLLHRSLANYV